ncbi:unnamed protein product [Linum tenue]|uniref:Bet v I/Major latex protein domain-containing protein n=3 Tax=Linum tenue TaxID=586396 RepID=A0AAV0PUG7_9ROSI|nr:unnamed protein product [Linum tenue]
MSLLRGKLEACFGIRLAATQHHEIFSNRPHHVSNMAPTKIKNCALHGGDFGQKGALLNWDYIHDGAHKVAKEIVEHIDDVNLSITFKVIEGDLTKEYKELKIFVKATPKSDNTSLIHWTLDYEKLDEDVAEPFSFMEFLVHLSKDIDLHNTKK